MSALAALDPEQRLRTAIAAFVHDPLGFVVFALPWGQPGPLVNEKGPRRWQRKVLERLGKKLRSAPAAKAARLVAEAIIRIAIASGHGIGKSALVAFLILWAVCTRVDTRGVVTANTATQLATKTWPELKKWHNLLICRHWFKCTATAIYSADPAHEKTWRVDAVPWSEHNTEAFAGLHNKGSRIILIYDEASAIADKVWEVSDGALTDEGTEIIWAAFGNPTRATGRFRETARRDRARWDVEGIDSRTVEGTNKAYLDEFVEANGGEDSDIVKIRVRGVFPSQSVMQFISEEDVEAAAKRHYRPHQYEFAPKIISLDPAWTGGDELVFGMRQGLVFQVLATLPRNDNDVVVAQRLAKLELDHKADGVFIDAGYGQGIYSLGKTWGLDWQLVHFGRNLPRESGVLNERVRIWAAMKQWLKDGGAIPDDPVLKQDLTGVETLPRSDGVLALESKQSMKDRGLPSPNRADALAITFAYDIRPKGDAARLGAVVLRGQTDRRPV
jgi:hypothetical protein